MRKKMSKDIVVRGVVGVVVVGHDGDILLRPSDRERERQTDRWICTWTDAHAQVLIPRGQTDRQAGRETTRDTRDTKYQCSGSHE